MITWSDITKKPASYFGTLPHHTHPLLIHAIHAHFLLHRTRSSVYQDTYKRQQGMAIARRREKVVQKARAKGYDGVDPKTAKANAARSEKLIQPAVPTGILGDMYSKKFLCTHG